jgi:hypothetical protein
MQHGAPPKALLQGRPTVFSPTIVPAPAAVLALIAGAFPLGLALLLSRSPRGRWCLAGAFAVALLAGLATWVPPLDQFALLRWPLVALAGAGLACLALSWAGTRWLLATGLACAASPRVQGATLLAATPLLLLGWCWAWEQQVTRSTRQENRVPDGPVPGGYSAKPHAVRTDRGTVLMVFDVASHETVPADEADEAALIASRGLGLRVIRTAPPDRGSNCHGWVFTGGHYWVDSTDVEGILTENGYEVVSTPRMGDLAIYRDHGTIAHSSVVQAVTDSGLVLLESKWARLGRFLHAPEDYCYPAPYLFYRSPRAGHLLAGLDGSPGEPASSESGVAVGE